MNFIKDNSLFQQNDTVLNNIHYAAQLRNMSIIPTSDFLISTICFWNDISKVHYFIFENSLLLVLLDPPFGVTFGHLLTSNLTIELVEFCKNEMQKLIDDSENTIREGKCNTAENVPQNVQLACSVLANRC